MACSYISLFLEIQFVPCTFQQQLVEFANAVAELSSNIYIYIYQTVKAIFAWGKNLPATSESNMWLKANQCIKCARYNS